ncbi:DUF4952 domain-containing protein [Undibacterium sp. Ji49W]|uniref:DUF4952 domain-containing protein n=1 Tax=Undibacterium sp. Ji49W TaxID=3413040 RepID=UPI003BF259DF
MHIVQQILLIGRMTIPGIAALLLSASLNMAWAANPDVSGDDPVCADFLQQIAKKPASLEFMSCEPTMQAQIHVLRVSYRVAGSKAAKVEAYLVRQAHMGRMKRFCCIWETHPSGHFASGHEFDYDISMASEETLVSRRADWPKIKWFYVIVELPLESP